MEDFFIIHRPSIEGWRETAGYAEERLTDVLSFIDERKKDVDEIIEASRTQGDWPGKRPYFENYARGDETDEEVEELAKKVQDKWCSAKELIDHARVLMAQACSIMSDLYAETTPQEK